MYDDDDEPEGPKSSATTYLSEGNALELQPGYKDCLVQRSKCYLHLGDTDSALRDAEESLTEDPEYIKGDFEHALVNFHRGGKLRPDKEEFKLGIQKSEEAIDNAIGKERDCRVKNTNKGYSKPTTQAARAQQPAVNRGKNPNSSGNSEKTVKQLLGELYADKEY
ncbi:Outer dynein arm-docking complex subunit 4 [Acropora cervicornis]|uniref:Outer dynein arm-docking complex subunit 4 n=1 Tax=Acropora cervicornis TaxID=6130 RepID=A0AAD9US03_ACRCE|nr:Outer dynein arm-docking complex subunit 4 [Acropora cervicornis]